MMWREHEERDAEHKRHTNAGSNGRVERAGGLGNSEGGTPIETTKKRGNNPNGYAPDNAKPTTNNLQLSNLEKRQETTALVSV